MGKNLHVALIGNPNTGKTSLFNQLTKLNQKVGNYPGITVERKEGVCRLHDNQKALVTDLPGTYSLNATSPDEQIVVDVLLGEGSFVPPDVAVVVSDVENLKRNLFLFTQIKDLRIPTILVVNMADVMDRKGVTLDIPLMEQKLHTKIALVSARKGKGIDNLKQLITSYELLPVEPCTHFSEADSAFFDKLRRDNHNEDLYKRWIYVTQNQSLGNSPPKTDRENGQRVLNPSEIKRVQQKETILRYLFINKLLKEAYQKNVTEARDLRSRLDRLLTHRIGGYVVFFLILLLIFQSIYSWSGYPMDLIDSFFASLSQWVADVFPKGAFTNLISEGIIPGIGGIVIFVPQIAFLFLFIALLEETGYMSRVVFLMDRIMRRFGLNGKSVVPLVSGTACAIPAVMASRNIDNPKERLITILVTPFTTCSARLPVYLIIIGLVIPDRTYLGLNLQGLTLMLLYVLGFAAALFAAWVLNKTLKVGKRSFFIAEMPVYKLPSLKNVAYAVVEKTKSFVVGAGKIILALSIVLWFLASRGPSEQFQNAAEIVTGQMEGKEMTPEELEAAIASHKLSYSWLGRLGHAIEPAIRPLGYNWEIGIGVLSSFAAREVFVGTLATIYSVEGGEEKTIRQRMANDVDPSTGEKVFDFPTGISLLLFYAFAMQCMSTLAVVRRETNSWKWPLMQLFFMTGVAYLLAFAAYQLLK